MHKNRQTLRNDQSGLVSFIVVAVLMLVITVLILSFARIVSREQLQTLDRQLNTQALYAAESGANDAMAAINAGSVPLNKDYDECDEFIKEPSPDLQSDLGNNVSYSCLLVDPSPKELQLPGVNTQNSIITKLQAKGGDQISSIVISWDSDKSVDSADVSGCPNNPEPSFTSNWSTNCEVGMIRFELVPFSSGVNSAALINGRAIGLLVPLNRSGFFANSLGYFMQTPSVAQNLGNISGADCIDTTIGGPRQCNFIINNVNQNTVYLRLRSIYRNTPVTIRAYRSGGMFPANQLELVGSQVEVDVTGRAGGVIKRIKQNRPIISSSKKGTVPEFAIQSHNSLCKRFTYYPGSAPAANVPTGFAPNAFSSNECDPTQP